MCFWNVAQLRSTSAQVSVYYTVFQVSLQDEMYLTLEPFSSSNQGLLAVRTTPLSADNYGKL